MSCVQSQALVHADPGRKPLWTFEAAFGVHPTIGSGAFSVCKTIMQHLPRDLRVLSQADTPGEDCE